MKHEPLQLQIEEPEPGSFVWMLVQTDGSGAPVKVARRAEAGADSYEAALASGTRALNAQLHAGEARATPA